MAIIALIYVNDIKIYFSHCIYFIYANDVMKVQKNIKALLKHQFFTRKKTNFTKRSLTNMKKGYL